MGQLKFKYSADQQYQLDAIDAVCDLFRGQEFLDARFMADLVAPTQEGIPGIAAPAQQQIFSVGHANGLRVSARQLEENLHAIQERNNLPATRDLTSGRLRDFSVEMETGTGKTYVYTRTIYELNRRYGLTKFVIVVPSVAIREGVRKSFESTKSHFESLYDHTPLDYERLVAAAKQYNVALEVNNSSFKKLDRRINCLDNYRTMLSLCTAQRVPIVVDTDAHDPSAVGRMDLAAAFLESVRMDPELILNLRGNLEKLMAFLRVDNEMPYDAK